MHVGARPEIFGPAQAAGNNASKNYRRSLRLSVTSVRRNKMNNYLRGQMDKLLRQNRQSGGAS